MLDKVKALAKKYPWLTVGVGGVALFLVFFLFTHVSKVFGGGGGGGGQRASSSPSPLPRPQQLPQVGPWQPRGATPSSATPVVGEVPPNVEQPRNVVVPLPVQKPVIRAEPITVVTAQGPQNWQEVVNFAHSLMRPTQQIPSAVSPVVEPVAPIAPIAPVAKSVAPPITPHVTEPFLTGVKIAPIDYDVLQQPSFADHSPIFPAAKPRGGAHVPVTVGDFPTFME